MNPTLRCLLIMCLALAPTSPALAGAWLRDTGTVFASTAARVTWPRDFASDPSRYDTLYLEYGLLDWATVGLDLGHSVSGAGKQIGFARLPLLRTDNSWQMAAELGWGEIGNARVVRPGLSLGRGLLSKHGYGWESADLSIEARPHTGTWDIKMDVTWGWARPENRFWILQVQTGRQHGDDAFARLAPSIVLPWGENTRVELGVTYGLWGEESIGALGGLWADF